MVAKRTRGTRVIVMTLALALTSPMGHSEASPADRPGEPGGEPGPSKRGSIPGGRPAWPRVFVSEPVARRVLTDALDDAAARLEQPACTRILTDFPAVRLDLTDTLDRLDTTIQGYLAMVVFIDEARHPLCLGPSLAFTTPGSRVVRVCGNELKRLSMDRDRLVAMVIHEVLHTLGLPENPPSSREITKRVRARCGSTK